MDKFRQKQTMSLLQQQKNTEMGSFLDYLENGEADKDESMKEDGELKHGLCQQTGYSNSYNLGNHRV